MRPCAAARNGIEDTPALGCPASRYLAAVGEQSMDERDARSWPQRRDPYLTVLLGQQKSGVAIPDVPEIRGWTAPTPLPGARDLRRHLGGIAPEDGRPEAAVIARSGDRRFTPLDVEHPIESAAFDFEAPSIPKPTITRAAPATDASAPCGGRLQ